MRSARLLASLLVVLGSGLTACTRNCPSAAAAVPATTSSGTPSRPIDVRFVAASSAGSVAQIVLMSTTSGSDPVHDINGHEVFDPNTTGSTTPATTLVRVRDYVGVGEPADSWLDERSHWRDMRGRGIGSFPILPVAAPGGPFVAIGGATSVVRFPLTAEDTLDAGMPVGDAGPSPQHAHEWEWPFPGALEATDAGNGAIAPTLGDLVVVPRFLPDHDLAFVARSAVSNAAQLSGGELFVLDIDDPAHVISLTTLSFETYADAGLHAAAGSLAFADGLVYLALDHQDFGLMPQLGPGLVVVIDPSMRSVRTVLRIPTLTNCTQIAPYHPPTRLASDPRDPGEEHRLVVTCLGSQTETPGALAPGSGFVYIEYDPAHPDTLPVIAQTISARSLSLPRPDGGVMPLYGHWVAYVSVGRLNPTFADRVIAANLDTGATQILASAPTNNGAQIVGLGFGSFDPGSGLLVVPNGFDGVWTWQVPHVFSILESSTAGYTFPDPVGVQVTGCGHLATHYARAVGAAGPAPVMPMPDAGTATDAAADDAASAVDAATPADAATPVDAAVPHDAGIDAF